jgi:hypothetical protein
MEKVFLTVDEFKQAHSINSNTTVRNLELKGQIKVKRLGRRKYITGINYDEAI